MSQCPNPGVVSHRWAELTAEEKQATPEEKDYFDEQVQFAYRSFRDKVCAML